jgi:hypothetical protein
MIYTYKVTLTIDRFDTNNADIHEREEKSNEFKHKNPLTARNAAFNRALSYDDILVDSKDSTEVFFKDSKDWYKEFNITVVFIDPKSQKEILLHESLFIDKETGTYDELMFRQVINSLVDELKILQSNSSEKIDSKTLNATFLPSNEIINVEIIPTPYISGESISIQEIKLD